MGVLLVRKKIKNCCVLDWLFILVLLFPLVVPLLFALFKAISVSGMTSYQDITSIFYNQLRDIFINFDNILGLQTFNDWFVTNILHLNLVNVGENVDLYILFPMIYSEYYILCYLIRLVVEFLLFLPEIVRNFINKIGGGF